MTYDLKKFLTTHIIDAMDKKRGLSIKEFGRSDLYKNENIDEINNWYLQLKEHILNKPPISFISSIEIVEKNNVIVEIKYVYAKSQLDYNPDISFRVNVINTTSADSD